MYNNQQVPYGGGYGGYPNNMAYQYGQPLAQPKMTQTLTKEQIDKLRNNGATFDLQITQEDLWKSICTHKDNGKFQLTENPDGTVTCGICGETFHMNQADPKEVTAATDTLIDLLQATKTMYLNIPEEMAAQYFQIIPLIKKLPKLYDLAVDDFNKYDGTVTPQSQSMNTPWGFNALNSLMGPASYMGGPMMGMGMQQPMYPGYPQQGPMGGMPMQNPMMGQMPQPIPQPMPQQNPMMGGGFNNPFGYYGQAQQMPQQPMGQPMPQQGQQPQQPAEQPVVQNKVMNV